MAALDVIFREHGVFPIAHTDLLQSDDASQQRHGEQQIAWMRDRFAGLRLFTYRQNVSGSAFAQGDLTSRLREVESNQTGTVTTSATGSFSGANEHIGSLLVVHDDAAGGGALPEGECTVVASNTATVATFDTGLPLSVALASGDDLTLLSPKVIDSAANDIAFVVCGIAMDATPDDDYGWFQFQGLHPAARHAASTLIAGDALIAGTAVVDTFGTSAAMVGGTANEGIWYVVGAQFAIHTSDTASTKSPVVMSLLPMYI